MQSALSPSSAAGAAVDLAGRALAGVVQVEDAGRGSGAGVIVDASGIIVTNAHVVRGVAGIRTSDGTRVDGQIIARDDALDLAAIRVEADGLEAIPCGDSQMLRPGQLVIAVGHPLGLCDAVTIGIVNRIPSRDDPRELIASNLTLNRGNSGGPLLDASGRLVGINAMVAGPGLGLSIPVHVVLRFLSRHVDPRPHIGISVQQIYAGLIVTGVQPEGSAEAAGLLPGDVIVAVPGSRSRGHDMLLDGLAAAGIGGTVALEVERAGVRLAVAVAVAAMA